MKLWKVFTILDFFAVLLLTSVFFVLGLHYTSRYLQDEHIKVAERTLKTAAYFLEDESSAKDITAIKIILKELRSHNNFLSIKVLTLQGKVIFSDVSDVPYYAIPGWAEKLIYVDAQTVVRKIYNKKEHVGNIELVTNPVSTGIIAWNMLTKILPWIVVILIITVSIISFITALITKTLRKLSKYASGIVAREHYDFKGEPWIWEFKNIHSALLKFEHNLHGIFYDQVELNKILREDFYKDKITGLGNNSHFKHQLKHLVSTSEGGFIGAMFFIDIANYQEHVEAGKDSQKALLLSVARVLSKTAAKSCYPVLGHVAESRFAMVLMNMTKEKALKISDELLRELKEKHLTEHSLHTEIMLNIAVTLFDHLAHVKDIEKHEEEALKRSKELGVNNIAIESNVHSEHANACKDWAVFVKNKIKEEDILLQQQPVYYYAEGNTLLFHNEIYSYTYGPDKEMLHAGEFLPFLSGDDATIEHDKLVFSQIFDRILLSPDGKQRFAVNLSLESLENKDFLQWLKDKCSAAGEMADRLNIEIAEFYVSKKLGLIRNLCHLVHPFGIQVGLDHFGCGFNSCEYLEDLPIDYVKLDGSYTNDVDKDLNNQLIIRSFVDVCHSLGIIIIATKIETENEKNAIDKCHTDGVEGFFVGLPN